MRRILQIALLAFVAFALGHWAFEKLSLSANVPTPTASVSGPETAESHVVVVTYFTTNVRCKSCLKIESLTRETLEAHFADETAAGKVRLDIRNIDQPGNKHFEDDYKLSFKTVVISDQWAGEERSWQKMDDVWKHLSAPETFAAYLSEGIHQKLNSDG